MLTKSLQILTFVAIALSCSILHLANATTFDCVDLEPKACKTKFGEQFEKDFKPIHLAAVRQIFSTFMEKTRAAKAEMPADDYFAKLLGDTADKLETDLKELENQVDDDEKIAEIIEHAMTAMQWKLKDDVKPTETFKQLMEKYEMEDVIVSRLLKLAMDVGKLWSEMYKGLRPQDLQEFPIYEQLNKVMKELQVDNKNTANVGQYATTKEVFAVEFDRPYFKTIQNLL